VCLSVTGEKQERGNTNTTHAAMTKSWLMPVLNVGECD